MTQTKFKLGNRVRDQFNENIVGIVVSYAFHLNGCQWCHIAPPATEDGKLPENIYLPEERLEFVDDGPKQKDASIDDAHYKLGDEVTDILTGFTGHVVVVDVPLHGQPRVYVEPPKSVNKDGKITDSLVFDECRIKLVKSKAAPQVPEQPEKRRERGCAERTGPSMHRRTA